MSTRWPARAISRPLPRPSKSATARTICAPRPRRPTAPTRPRWPPDPHLQGTRKHHDQDHRLPRPRRAVLQRPGGALQLLRQHRPSEGPRHRRLQRRGRQQRQPVDRFLAVRPELRPAALPRQRRHHRQRRQRQRQPRQHRSRLLRRRPAVHGPVGRQLPPRAQRQLQRRHRHHAGPGLRLRRRCADQAERLEPAGLRRQQERPEGRLLEPAPERRRAGVSRA
mmetsp:Transcript_65307/g.154255  ORF Transcript_65307/g.154255 Transcript_65307/m.154255 type:complete len:223 (-) Transcript_65307:758-1426(-)